MMRRFWFFSCCRGNRPKDILAAHEAVKNGDEEALNRLLVSGLGANSRIKPGDYTLLHRAVINSNPKNIETMLSLIKLLLAKGADPNELYYGRDSYFSPLHSAARKAVPEVVQVLMEARADINLLNDKKRTALSYAEDIDNERGEQVVALLKNPAKNLGPY